MPSNSVHSALMSAVHISVIQAKWSTVQYYFQQKVNQNLAFFEKKDNNDVHQYAKWLFSAITCQFQSLLPKTLVGQKVI